MTQISETLTAADELQAAPEVIGTSSKVHKCPSCSGTLSFSPEEGKLKCDYCSQVVSIETMATEIIENCLESALAEGLGSWSDQDLNMRSVTCENCGAQLIFDAGTQAKFCSYCGSSHIREHAMESTYPPAYLIPFKVPAKTATDAFKTWISKRWFAPNDLKKAYQGGRLIGTYVPYWTYDAQTFSHYTAQRGDHYYVTKTRTVNGQTETYTERHTRWTPVSGAYDHGFDDVLVCASAKIDPRLVDGVDSFNTANLIAYKPDYLSGFLAERYSVTLQDGWKESQEKMSGTISHEITQQIGGDEVRFLDVHTTYENITFKHILLPIWISSYNYKDKLFHFLINGESGAVSGEYPKSPIKIALLILAICILIGLAYVYVQHAQ